MQLHALWIFSRAGECVFYEEWETSDGGNRGAVAENPVRQLQAAAQAQGSASAEGDAHAPLPLDEKHKLMFGMLYSLKKITEQCVPQRAEAPGADGGLKGFATNSYKLHFFESASRVKIVLLTEPNAPDLQETLRSIYSDIYVEYVVKNPRYDVLGTEQISSQNCELFMEHFQRKMAALAGSSKAK